MFQVPTTNWKDVVKELDHPGFFVRDRQALVLLTTGLRRAIPAELYIDLLYNRWNNTEGQVTIEQSVFLFKDIFHSYIIVIMVSSSYPLSGYFLLW